MDRFGIFGVTRIDDHPIPVGMTMDEAEKSEHRLSRTRQALLTHFGTRFH